MSNSEEILCQVHKHCNQQVTTSAHLKRPVLSPNLESCKYKVAIRQEENLSCFNKMKQETPCNEEHPNCITEKQNGLICIKWFAADLMCVDNDLNKILIEKQTCAQDQNTLRCTNEFPKTNATTSVESKGSPLTLYCRGPCILLLVIIIWMNASCFL